MYSGFHIQVGPMQVPKCRAAEQAADQGEGQISQQLIERMEGTLREELEADKVAVTDVYGDGRHVGIDVVSKLFEGQSSVKRQRMVYKVEHPPPFQGTQINACYLPQTCMRLDGFVSSVDWSPSLSLMSS